MKQWLSDFKLALIQEDVNKLENLLDELDMKAFIKNLAKERYKKYENLGFWVCEGHYHQNLILDEKDVKYFNLASFAYERSFFVVECCQEIKFREQKLRGQNV